MCFLKRKKRDLPVENNNENFHRGYGKNMVRKKDEFPGGSYGKKKWGISVYSMRGIVKSTGIYKGA